MRPRRPGEPNVVTGVKLAASIDRDEAERKAEPVRASTSESLRRCGFCSHWVSPKRDRCEKCRQKVGNTPLIGLKPVA